MSGSVGSDPQIAWQVAPTGGIVILKLKSAAPADSWSLSRAVVSGTALVQQATLFKTPDYIQPVFLDIGDGTKAPLDPALNYQYTFKTAAGTAVTDPISPATSIILEPDHLTEVLLRALQSGFRSLVIPAGFNNRPQVFFAMPMGVQPTIPMVSLNDTLIQQGDIPIGQNSPNNTESNMLVVGGQALRHYTIAVMAASPAERGFYRDAVLAIFNAILGPILHAIGENSTHRFQIHNSQVEGGGQSPGFFYSEILLEMTGAFSVGVATTYGVIQQITGSDQTGVLFTDTTES
jgi:hypothetical protein